MKKSISIGLLGLGTVGAGVVKIINDHQKDIVDQVGCHVKIDKILVRNIEKERQVDIDKSLLTTNSNDILDNSNIDIVIEVMGGVKIAREYTLKALKANKHVITSNKDLIALHGPELERTARNNNCDLFYEASVGGGIPLLKGLLNGLVADRITRVMGILNGTTNYILTEMSKEGVNYDSALQKAKEMGLAAIDPSEDVKGLDTASKMVILARLAFSANINLQDVKVEGISELSLTDLKYATQLGYTIKLIGIADRVDNNLEITVQPTLLSNHHPLASVKNMYNAVYINGENIGETMFYGLGTGSLSTATAVMSDVITVIKNMILDVNGKSTLGKPYQQIKSNTTKGTNSFYLRLHVKDEVGSFAIISNLFNQLGISFERILQKPSSRNEFAEIVVVTYKTPQNQFSKAVSELRNLHVVHNVDSYFRVEENSDIKN